MTKTPRNEFDRLVDQDPADGLPFDESSLIANLKERLPEASLSDDFPQAVETPLDGQEAQEIPKVSAGSESAHTDPSQGTAAISEVVPLDPRKRRPLAWGQIAASVAITSLIVGAGATAAANGGLRFDAFGGSSSGAEHVTLMSEDAGTVELDSSGTAMNEGPEEATEEAAETDHAASQPLTGGGRDSYSGMDGASTARTEGAQASADAAIAPFRDTFRNRFEGKGLSSTRETATAYGFDERAAVKKETFEKLKEVFGVKGTTKQEWGSFYVNDSDSTYLNSSGDGTGGFYFGTQHELVEQEDLNFEASLERAKELMTELGVDTDRYTFDATEHEYWTWIEPAVAPTDGDEKAAAGGEKKLKTVKVRATLNELGPESWAGSWEFDFSGDTLFSVYGSLAQLVDLGEYEVVSQQEAVDRLNDPHFGVSNMNYPTDWDQQVYELYRYEEVGEKEGPKAHPAPNPGMKFSWSVGTVTLTKGTLKVAQIGEGDGTYLVPVWEFNATNGATYQVLAVADEGLDFSPTSSR
ncbi:hypothetical protein ACFSYH_13285 [Populibacterium corticicola]|uniref:Uncharacterized protein n=1 Tax=Populibacterium corticicola TaxID=1812826 RepID=A0ABW5XIJ8_9MICO